MSGYFAGTSRRLQGRELQQEKIWKVGGQGKEEDADETIISSAGIGEKEAWCTSP